MTVYADVLIPLKSGQSRDGEPLCHQRIVLCLNPFEIRAVPGLVPGLEFVEEVLIPLKSGQSRDACRPQPHRGALSVLIPLKSGQSRDGMDRNAYVVHVRLNPFEIRAVPGLAMTIDVEELLSLNPFEIRAVPGRRARACRCARS